MGVLNHGSLFSGIGGFDLASEWMGWNNVFHCEIESFPRKVLNYYWPNAISYEDIKTTDFTIHRGQIDILTGGFPCQPFSVAGKRKGTEDDRNLWPEMLRAIREISPTFIVGENVLGLINWSGGLVFEQVQADLENEGYEVIPVILPACGKDAPHKRERIWFVAYSSNARVERMQRGKIISGEYGISSDTDSPRQQAGQLDGSEIPGSNREGGSATFNKSEVEISSKRDASDTTSKRLRGESNWEGITRQLSKEGALGWELFPTQSPICSRNDGISERLDGITFPKWRSESIKAYGNAIVPQVVFEIFKVIEQNNQKQLL